MVAKSINDFITSKNESPQKYNRILVIESLADKLAVTIRY
jgi:hypothetical protein